jgi:hypothetical protein
MPQLFPAHAGRQSLSSVLSPGCSQQRSPPAALLPEITPDQAAIPHGAWHRSYHTTVIRTAIVPRPCGPPELKRHGPKHRPHKNSRTQSPGCPTSRPRRTLPSTPMLNTHTARGSSYSAPAFRPNWPKRGGGSVDAQDGQGHGQAPGGRALHRTDVGRGARTRGAAPLDGSAPYRHRCPGPATLSVPKRVL